MQQMKIDELKPHPRNNEFFDDVNGEKWQEFLTSIKTRGVIEPIVITPDKVIVSGHQRVRACQELGIPTIMCDVHTYDNEDQILQDLIETNIRQRGDVGGSAKKVGKRIKELERIYGISVGRPNYENNSQLKTQEQLASDMNMDVRTLQNYKLMSDMIPELEELIDTGIVTKTTVLAMMKQLAPKEQEELISSLDTTKKITQRQMQEFIDDFKAAHRDPQPPADYETTKKELNAYKKDYKTLHTEYQNKVHELQDLRKQMNTMLENTPEEEYVTKLKTSVMSFCGGIHKFIEEYGGYVWLTDKINEIPEFEREGYIQAVHSIKTWADQMEYNINNKVKEI